MGWPSSVVSRGVRAVRPKARLAPTPVKNSSGAKRPPSGRGHATSGRATARKSATSATARSPPSTTRACPLAPRTLPRSVSTRRRSGTAYPKKGQSPVDGRRSVGCPATADATSSSVARRRRTSPWGWSGANASVNLFLRQKLRSWTTSLADSGVFFASSVVAREAPQANRCAAGSGAPVLRSAAAVRPISRSTSASQRVTISTPSGGSCPRRSANASTVKRSMGSAASAPAAPATWVSGSGTAMVRKGCRAPRTKLRPSWRATLTWGLSYASPPVFSYRPSIRLWTATGSRSTAAISFSP